MQIHTAMDKRGKRFFERTPVVDAEAPLTIVVRPTDIKKGVRHDPMSCAFAAASKRLFGSTAAYFARTVAYVDFFDRDNVRRVHRYLMHDDTREMIKAFDKTGEATAAGYVLSPPCKSERLDYQSAASRKWRKGEAKKRAKHTGDTARFNPVKDRRVVAADAERDGRGHTQFRRRLENEEATS